jgi:hypothetical protein
MNHSGEKQTERRQRGEDFQDEIRRSWRLIPGCWRLRITDGKGTGDRPADDLVLLEHINILSEEKRTAGDRFELSFLRPNQLRGLLAFDNVLERNKGLVFVSFLNADVDEAYAFRLADALPYMKQQNRRYVTIDELRQRFIPCVPLTTIQLTEDGETVRGYNLKGVQECYK